MTGRAGSRAARERQEAQGAKLAGATAASSPRTAPQPAVEPAASARQGSGCSVPGNRGRPETPALGAEASAAPCAAPGGRGHGFLQWRFWFHGRGVFSGTRDRLRFLPWSPGRGVGGSPRPTARSELPAICPRRLARGRSLGTRALHAPPASTCGSSQHFDLRDEETTSRRSNSCEVSLDRTHLSRFWPQFGRLVPFSSLVFLHFQDCCTLLKL